MDLGCVIMAAGGGRRFGGGKLLAAVGGKPLYLRAMEAVSAGVFATVSVVTGDERIMEAARERGFLPVENKNPELGVSRTIFLGLEALGDMDGAVFMTADQPFLTAVTLKKLADAFDGVHILAAAHNGERGNPVLFPKSFFPELLTLEGDTGGGKVIKAHPERVKLIEVPAEELMDVDTQEALRTL